MLKLQLPRIQLWNSDKEVFEYIESCTIEFNHCLKAISEWEAKFRKPFITDLEKFTKTDHEIREYFKIMTVTKGVNPLVYLALKESHIKELNAYMEDSYTATTIKKENGPKGQSEIMTSELIYYYMTALNIPFTCESWHLNRLLMLIDVCSIKNQPQKKMSQKELYKENNSIMAQRRAAAKAARKG